MHIPTFHHPGLSLFQSALHQTLVRRNEPGTEHMSARHPAMQATVAAGLAFTQPGRPVDLSADAGPLLECARLSVEYLFASAEDKPLLYAEITGGVCDPYWAEAITTYEWLRASGQSVPYIPYNATTSPNPPVTLSSDTVTIALLADWGMNTPLAQNVLAQAVTPLNAGNPPVQQAAASMLIHMGDIYYAGTPTECTAFLATVRAAVPGAFTDSFPVFAVPGNHEYYSGAFGYFQTVLPELSGQTNSFFCLRTAQWQVVALDTGRNDCDPFTVETNITSLTSDQEEWLASVMSTAGQRRTILLTHHQLNSAAGSVGQGVVDGQTVTYGINPLLYQQISPYFGSIAVWLWGHEHNTVIFNPQTGLPLGRCIGSASIPMQVDMQPYAPAAGLSGVNGIPVPTMDLSIQLSNNGTDYFHGFAVLSLCPTTATVNYYQVPLPEPGVTDTPAATWMTADTFPYVVPVYAIPDASVPA